ncbi:MAG: PEGA domain-containing protein, partial [Deinococcota bacterium]|nr:PEGA domain-containing protein [Deinococcota bacterium]
DTYADITAYILQVNEFPAGDEELPAEQAPLEEMALEPEAAEVPEEAPEEEPEEEDEVAGQGELTINLDLMEGLTAIVLGPDGYLYQAQGTTGENLMGLMPGSYAVMVTGPDHEVASNQIEVPAGQPVTVSLALEPFGGEGQEEAQEGTDFEGPEQQAGDEQTGEDEEAQDGQPEDEDGQPGQGEEGLGRQGESEQQEDNGLPHQQGMRLSQQEDTPQEAQQENDPEEEPQEEQAADFEGPEQQADDEQTGEQEDEPEADAPQGNLEIGLEPESVRLIVVGPDAYLFQSLSSTQETLRRLVPGRYVVGASGEGYRSAVDEIDVRPEETVNLSLTLQPLGSERQEEQQDPQEAEVEEAGEGPATAPDAEETQAAGEAAEEPDEPDELAVTAEEGWFTAEQIALGHTAYAQHCASCHGSALEGRTAPPLAGESFLNRWDTAWDLYDYTRSHMPQFNPGSLEDKTYVNVTAYTLYVNGFPAGEEELPPDQERLEGLTIDPEMVEVEAEEEPDEAPDEEPEEAPEEEAPEGAQDKERFEGMSLEAEASQTAEEML